MRAHERRARPRSATFARNRLRDLVATAWLRDQDPLVSSAASKREATLSDFLAIPAEERWHELLAGEIVPRAVPSGEHGGAQTDLVIRLGPAFQRPAGRGGPGGWWLATEVEILLPTGSVVRPDVAGWRRERVPTRPTGMPVEIAPDWVCEVLSPSNASDDTVKKLRIYHAASVPHDWLLDPRAKTLTVMRWSNDGYTTVLAAERGEVVRAEPFDAIELEVSTLFGEDAA